MTEPRPGSNGRVVISLMSTGAVGAAPQGPPRGLWLPATALAVSMALAAVAGVTLGILAATHWSIAGERWVAVVQAHAMVQLWGWFAVSIAALVFEFIVRLNRHPMLPFRPRAAVLLLFTAGAVVSASGGVLGAAEQPFAILGSLLLLGGSAWFAALVFRVPFGRPLGLDLHPLFFRTGAAWLVVAALLAAAGSWSMTSGAMLPGAFDTMVDVFLRGFVLHIVIAVGLRAFPGHVGLPPVEVPAQRVLFALLNASVMLVLVSSQGFGLPGVPLLADMGALCLAGAIAWATSVFGLDQAVRRWGHRADRVQVMVPVSWLALVVFGLVIAWQAGTRLIVGDAAPLLAVGAARHVYMLGFVAPLLLAMMHVVLERFGIGYLIARGWLTAAFVLLVVAWPLRALPPLFGVAEGALYSSLLGTAGLLAAAGLLLASVAAARNAQAVAAFARRRGGN